MDRSSKILLALIAIGLWANLVVSVTGTSRAEASSADVALQNIRFFVAAIYNGTCANHRLCGP